MNKTAIVLTCLAIAVMAIAMWRLETMPSRIVDELESMVSTMDEYVSRWTSGGIEKECRTVRRDNEDDQAHWDRHKAREDIAMKDCPPDQK